MRGKPGLARDRQHLRELPVDDGVPRKSLGGLPLELRHGCRDRHLASSRALLPAYPGHVKDRLSREALAQGTRDHLSLQLAGAETMDGVDHGSSSLTHSKLR